MLTANGCVVAMDDAAIVWKPRNGNQKRIKLDARASVLLGLIGPLGVVDKIVVGDEHGGVNFITLATMEVLERFVVGNSKVRSLCASSMSGESVLVGCENGAIFMVGKNVPNRVINLFELDGPASALRIIGQDLHIQQGWERKVLAWDGQKSLIVA